MKETQDEDFKFYYDLAKFEVQMLNSRGNLFLLFHSLLITGTAQVWTDTESNTTLLKTVFATIGILVALIWAWLARRTGHTERACYKKLNEYSLFKATTGEPKKIGNRHIVGILLPSVIFAGWLCILSLIYMK